MATTADIASSPKPIRRISLVPERSDRMLAAGAVLLLAAVLTALAKGHADWSRVPALVWVHLLTIMVALALTPVILLRRRGDRWHRRLGTVWVVAMIATAATSLFVHVSRPQAAIMGQFSPIHILSVWTLIQVPIIWWSARTRNIARHRGSVRGMVIGALLIAGFFTFPFDRLLGHWLFS